jgi:hypothetical protein
MKIPCTIFTLNCQLPPSKICRTGAKKKSGTEVIYCFSDPGSIFSVDIPTAECPHFRVICDKLRYEADLSQLLIHVEMESIEIRGRHFAIETFLKFNIK